MQKNQKNRRLEMTLPAMLLGMFIYAMPAHAQDNGEGYYNYDQNSFARADDTPQAVAEDIGEEAGEEAAAESGSEEESASGMKQLQAAPPPPQRQVVTSVQKCFDQIGREAALEIRKKSLTPYADCQKRLRLQAKEKAAEKEQAEKDVETPQNYVRVSEKDGAEDDAAEEESAKEKKLRKPSSSRQTEKSGR